MSSTFASADKPHPPRPWFLSLSALWADDAQGNDLLVGALRQLGFPSLLPYHHIEVRNEARHLTVFAILRINATPHTGYTLRDYARDILSTLSEDSALLARLNDAFRQLTLEADQVRVSDSGTTVQFRGNTALAELRAALGALLEDRVANLVETHPEGLLTSLVNDPHKSCGDHAFASIARSPLRWESRSELWSLPIEPPVTFTFRRIHLVTSDEALSNPRLVGIEDLPIGGIS